MEGAIKKLYAIFFTELSFCVYLIPTAPRQTTVNVTIVNVLLGKCYTDFAQILEKQLHIEYKGKYSDT